MSRKIAVRWHEDYSVYAPYQPCLLEFFGKKQILRTWPDLLYAVMLALYQRHEDAFKKMNARYDFGHIFLRSSAPERGTRGLPNDLQAPFLITRMTPNETLTAIDEAMRWCHIDEGDVRITCELASPSISIAPSMQEVSKKRDIQEEKFQQRCANRREFGVAAQARPAFEFQKTASRLPLTSRTLASQSRLEKCAPCAEKGAKDDGAGEKHAEPKRVFWHRAAFYRFENSTPVRIVLTGVSQDVASWPEVFQRVCEWLSVIDKDMFLSAFKAAPLVYWIPPKAPYSQMRKPFFVSSCRLWIEADHGALEILETLQTLLMRFQIDAEKVMLWAIE